LGSDVEIDGSQGEGGGQILRTSFALAAMGGHSLRVRNIRSGRERPGLLRRHQTGVRAIAELCGGTLTGDALGSTEVFFTPGPVRAGAYHFSIASPGSACLLFQTVLWPLLFADGESTVVIEGGTHNPFAPPFDYIKRVFLPVIERMGATVDIRIERYGFTPLGGGRLTAKITGNTTLSPIDLCDAGPVLRRRATALVANLPGTISIRELREVRSLLHWKNEECLPQVVQDGGDPGNVLLLEVEREGVSEMASVIGVRNLPSEDVAAVGAEAIESYLRSGAPVGICLADQLVLPFALAKGGRYRTSALSPHATTMIDVVQQFCGISISAQENDGSVDVVFTAL